MKDLIGKLSSYNLFTNLLPGILFVVFLRKITVFDLIFEPLFLALFFYYFVGIVINRFGSLIVEPILKKIKFLYLVEYSRYVQACKLDCKIETLSENNNMCRCFIALCLLLPLSKGYEWLGNKYTFFADYGYIMLILFLLILFLFSYRKQTKYIVKRCEANLD